eukprot:scaffold1971_cov356-Pinguiococcus_pyrenoidosus.AAC.4
MNGHFPQAGESSVSFCSSLLSAGEMLSPSTVAATWRFCAIIVNFLVHVMVFYSRIDLIRSALVDPDEAEADSNYADLQEQFLGVWSFASICFFVQLLSLLGGLSTQLTRLCTLAAILHSFGAFCNLWAVADAWAIQRYHGGASSGPSR